MINYISHKKSKQIVNGLPKLPTADQLKEGEIAINYANGYETLSIKNSDNEITTFSSTEQIEKYVDTTIGNKLGSGFTSGNSANTVTSVIESNEKVVSASLNDLNDRKLDASAYTPTDLSDYYKKEETSSKTELDAALKLKANSTDLATKANTTDLTAHTGNSTVHITSDERTKWNGKISNAQYNKTDKKIYFYSGATTETPVSNIDATDFIKDGMVSNVEIKDVTNSGSCLVITFNADAGKQDITIPVTKIFNPANYYLKSETSGKTEIATALDSKANTSELTKYYKKEETSGKTELDTAFGLKANTSDLTTHTGDSTIHITSAERTKWNDAATNSHTHANKAVLDTITAIDKELSETSNNLVVNSAITKVIEDNEKITSASLNDLNERKLDASAYTPTDLSDYYKKEETSGKTDLDTALGLKANTSDLATKANTTDLRAHTDNSSIHITSDERTKWDGAATTLASHTGNSTVHITSTERTKWDNAATSSHTHANKAVLDTITTIDTELSETSNNLVVNSAITKVIVANEKISSSALNDLNDRKLDASAYTPTDLSDYYKKEETSGKTDLNTAFGLKANASDLTAHISDNIKHITSDERTKWNNATTTLATHTGDSTVHITTDERTKWNGKISNAQYNSTDKKIYFYSGATTENPVANIDATDFIKDGMVSNVEIKDVTDSGSCLVITFNADAGKQDINIPISTIFNPANYYQKSETSGSTELNTAFGLKANVSDLTAHTGNNDIHITADERTKWNNAATNSHTHTNKDVLDTITAIDSELNENSKNLVVNSAITTVILENEKIVSTSLNDLNDRKLDASAYTPTDLSDYYKKEETSGKTELTAAFNSKANSSDLATKANQSDLTAHTGNSTVHITSDERTKWNNAATNSHTHANKDVLDKITAIDTELSKTSNNLVVSSAITKVLIENEKVVSASLNDLNDRKLDINYTGFTGTTLSGVTSIIQAIQKIADKLDKTTTNS